MCQQFFFSIVLFHLDSGICLVGCDGEEILALGGGISMHFGSMELTSKIFKFLGFPSLSNPSNFIQRTPRLPKNMQLTVEPFKQLSKKNLLFM
jgi:hypothetical protein